MIFRELRPVPGRPGLWLHADASAWRDGLPEPPRDAARSGRDRGSIARVEAGGVRAWIKTPRRGGALAALLPDAFASSRRSVAEAHALERLAPLGIAPRCLGLFAPRGGLARPRGWLIRPCLLVEDVSGARDLLALAAEGERGAALARAAGAAVRAMHDAGVSHADLNAANIVARREPDGAWRAWIVDLDDAALSDASVGDRRRVAEVLRLCRSIDKWDVSAQASASARAAFLRAALPRGMAVAALRRARRAHAWRRALGRRPRPLRLR